MRYHEEKKIGPGISYIKFRTVGVILTAVFLLATVASISYWVGKYSANTTDEPNLLPSIRKESEQFWRRQASIYYSLLNDRTKRLGKLDCELQEDSGYASGCRIPEDRAPDPGLHAQLANLFKRKRVASLSEGKRPYRVTEAKDYLGFDSIPDIEETTNAQIKFLDLSIPQFPEQSFDWVLCLETAEYIEKNSEAILMKNLARLTRDGLILTWTSGPNEPEKPHQNPQPREFVVAKLKGVGLYYDHGTTKALRKASFAQWLKQDIMVFRKKGTL